MKVGSVLLAPQNYSEPLSQKEFSFLNHLDSKINNPRILANNDSKNNDQSQVKEEQLKVARQFESMFIQLMLKQMRKSTPDFSLTGKSNGQKTYESMLDSEYAKQMASEGQGLGIARMIMQYIDQIDGQNLSDV